MPLSSDYYKAIELAVKTTGQQGVDDLGQAAIKAKQDFEAFQNQLKAGATVNAQSVAELAKLKASVDQTAEAYAAAVRVINGKSAEGAVNVGALARSFQELGRGVQDVTLGGILGGMNNLTPLVTNLGTAMKLTNPQVAALGAAVDIVASSAYAAYMNWGTLARALGIGVGPRLIPDLVEVNKQLDELRNKPVKSLIDLADIDRAEKLSSELSKIKNAYDALDAPSKDQAERGKRFSEAVRENGGRANVTQAVLDAELGPESPQIQAARKQLADIERHIQAAKDAGNYNLVAGYEISKQNVENSRAGQASVDRQNRQRAVEEMIGRAATGEDASIRHILDLVDTKQSKFDANGVNAPKFRNDLVNADQTALDEEKRRKQAGETFTAESERAEKERKAAEEEQKAADHADDLADRRDQAVTDRQSQGMAKLEHDAARAREKTIVDATRSAGGGYRDEAEATLFRDAQAGHNLDQSIDRERPLLEKALRDRGNLDPAIVGDVASQILAKAREAALNAIDSGQPPKLIRDADHARHAEAKGIEAGFLPGAAAMIARNQLAAEQGAPVAHNMKQVQRFEGQGIPYALDEGGARQFVEAEVARNLRASHQDPGLAHDIAAKAFAYVNQSYVKGMAETGSGIGALMGVIQNAQGQISNMQQQQSAMLGQIDVLIKNNADLRMRSQRLGMQARKTMQQRPSLIQY